MERVSNPNEIRFTPQPKQALLPSHRRELCKRLAGKVARGEMLRQDALKLLYDDVLRDYTDIEASLVKN